MYRGNKLVKKIKVGSSVNLIEKEITIPTQPQQKTPEIPQVGFKEE